MLSKILVVCDAHLLRNNSSGEIASTDRDSHESENIEIRSLYWILTWNAADVSWLERCPRWDRYISRI